MARALLTTLGMKTTTSQTMIDADIAAAALALSVEKDIVRLVSVGNAVAVAWRDSWKRHHVTAFFRANDGRSVAFESGMVTKADCASDNKVAKVAAMLGA